jgi:hypothetical protein
MGVKSDQQVEQKKGMLESPTLPLQKEHEVGSMISRIRLKKCITPQGSYIHILNLNLFRALLLTAVLSQSRKVLSEVLDFGSTPCQR